MKPYYEDSDATLYLCDVRELGGRCAYADMVLADPPYGETSIKWDKWPDGWVKAAMSEAGSIAPLWCFGSMRMFLREAAEFAGYRFVQEIVWEKHNGSGFNVDRFRRVHELAAMFVQDGIAWDQIYKCPQFTNDATKRVVRKKEKPAHWHGATGPTTYVSEDGGPRLMRSVLQVRSEHGRAEHPTQKPLGILRPLIEYSCPPHGLVFVPFAGAGSEMVAAKESGRRVVGCEINERYCEITARRLSQGVLFSPSPSVATAAEAATENLPTEGAI